MAVFVTCHNLLFLRIMPRSFGLGRLFRSVEQFTTRFGLPLIKESALATLFMKYINNNFLSITIISVTAHKIGGKEAIFPPAAGKCRLLFELLLISCLVCFPINIKAQETALIDKIFTFSEKKILLNGVIITRGSLKNNNSIHSLNKIEKINIPKTEFTEEDFSKYEMICDEKAFFPYNLNNSKLTFYNKLAAFSKLSGIKYYSRSDKKVQNYIIKSHRIGSLNNKKKIKDAEYGSIGQYVKNYFLIQDNRFGEMIFRNEIINKNNIFAAKNICVHPLSKYFNEICRSGEYETISIFIYDSKEKGFFYYSINALRIRSDYFLKLGLLSAESFANRLRANTAYWARMLGLNWDDKIMAFQ